jgi:hypothetical protein
LLISASRLRAGLESLYVRATFKAAT